MQRVVYFITKNSRTVGGSLPPVGPPSLDAAATPSLRHCIQCRLYLHWGPGHPPAERGPSLEIIYRVSLTVDLWEGLRQKISSIYCTVICNYPISVAQEQPFTGSLLCITKRVNR